MAQDWAHETHPYALRGKLIRRLWLQPLLSPAHGAPWNTALIFGENLGYYTNANWPTSTQIVTFKQNIALGMASYIDSIGLSLRSDISDDTVGRLFGDRPDGAEWAGSNSTRALAFVETTGVPSAAGGASQETGDALARKKRELSSKAISNPDAYVDEYNKELADIETKSLVVYNESLKKYFSTYNYPEKEAKRMAYNDKEAYKEMLKRQFDLLYKADEYKLAGSKIYKSK